MNKVKNCTTLNGLSNGVCVPGKGGDWNVNVNASIM